MPANSSIVYKQYDSKYEESDIPKIRELMKEHLSEPYSLYVYRYFMYESPQYSFMAFDTSKNNELIGAIVGNVSKHKNKRMRGYIAMIATKPEYRGQGIGSELVSLVIKEMKEKGKVDEIVLETETINVAAMKLYENIGFVRSKRLYRYYLNYNDAYRFILPLTERSTLLTRMMPDDLPTI